MLCLTKLHRKPADYAYYIADLCYLILSYLCKLMNIQRACKEFVGKEKPWAASLRKELFRSILSVMPARILFVYRQTLNTLLPRKTSMSCPMVRWDSSVKPAEFRPVLWCLCPCSSEARPPVGGYPTEGLVWTAMSMLHATGFAFLSSHHGASYLIIIYPGLVTAFNQFLGLPAEFGSFLWCCRLCFAGPGGYKFAACTWHPCC